MTVNILVFFVIFSNKNIIFKAKLNFNLLIINSIAISSVIIFRGLLTTCMYDSLMTLLFFPDWTNGLPSDFLILHFFVGTVIFPFNMIHAKAKGLMYKSTGSR